MDEDNVIYEMFLELTEKLEENDPEGRMRVLSQNPRYVDDYEIKKEIQHKR